MMESDASHAVLPGIFARPLIWVAIGLFVLAGLIAGAAYTFRDNLSRYSLKPAADFGQDLPPAMDYAKASAWAALPKAAVKPTDVFFIYPSVYYQDAGWNAPADDEESQLRLASAILPLFAGPFADGANLFVPRYRQAGPYAFMTNSRNAQSARLLAYDDIAKAFENYLRFRNASRPFAIAAYGQGALYAARLIHEKIAPDNAVRARMVAAYLGEIALPQEQFATYLAPLKLCAHAEDLSCVNVWHSTSSSARGEIPKNNAPVWRPDGRFDSTKGRTLACVNPLTWTVDGRAGEASMNLGVARLTQSGEPKIALTPAETSADCWNGLLYVDEQPAPFFQYAGPRYRDLFPPSGNLFYENIRQNFASRIAAYAQAQETQPANELPASEVATDPLQ